MAKFIIVSLIFSLFISCANGAEPLDRENQYAVNITYIKDEGVESFEPMDFMNIFNESLPSLTYEILGYKIKYNLITGIGDKYFYDANKKIVNEKRNLFERDYIEIENVNLLKECIINSLSKENSLNIIRLFKREYGDTAEAIAENMAPKIIKNISSVWNSPLANGRKLLIDERYKIYTAQYWRIMGREFEDSNIIIVNIPISANYKGMSAKSIAEGGFIDRLIIGNGKINPTKSLAVISTYPFLSKDEFFSSPRNDTDYETTVKVFEYYVLQTIGMMFPKYDTHEFEKHCIMSEVNNFDYYNWYSNIVNFPLREPYKTIKKYADSL